MFISCRLEVRRQYASVQNSNRTDKFQWRCPDEQRDGISVLFCGIWTLEKLLLYIRVCELLKSNFTLN